MLKFFLKLFIRKCPLEEVFQHYWKRAYDSTRLIQEDTAPSTCTSPAARTSAPPSSSRARCPFTVVSTESGRQKVDLLPTPPDKECVICYEPVPDSSLPWLHLRAPCCGRHLHSDYVQSFAMTSGTKDFKCPNCNNKDNIVKTFKKLGVYLPPAGRWVGTAPLLSWYL